MLFINKKYLDLLRHQNKKKLFFNFLLNLLNALVEVIGIAFIFALILNLIENNDEVLIIDVLNFSSSLNTLILLIAIIYILKILVSIFCIYYQKKIIFDFQLDLLSKLLKYYLNTDYEKTIEENNSIKLRYLTSETKNSIVFFSAYLNLYTELIIVFSISLFLFLQNIFLTVLIFSILIIFSLFYFFLVRKKIIFLAKQKIYFDNNLFKKINQSINGINEIKVYKLEKYFFDIVKGFAKKTNLVSLKNFLISSFPRYYFETIIIFLLLISVAYLKNDNQNNEQILSDLSLLTICLLRTFPSFTKIVSSLQELNNYKQSIDLILNQLNKKPDEIKEKKIDYKDKINFRNIEFKNVNFKYQKNEDYTFKNLKFQIQKGEIIGIQGPSGSGKTTLINLLTGILKPSSGEIYVNGRPRTVNDLNLFSIVTQKPLIINDSIKANIALGQNLEKDFNSDYYEKIIRICRLNDFINNQKEKSNTLISDNGLNISGGQSQRILLARALYLKKQILILDEATNALDKKTEKEILGFLKNLKEHLTLIIISHDHDCLSICDKRFIVDEISLRPSK